MIKFINDFSSEEIKPYPVKKLLTIDDYNDKYKERHIKISHFYGDLNKWLMNHKMNDYEPIAYFTARLM